MCISDIKEKFIQNLPVKTTVVYLAASLLCVLIANIYTKFGHGVRSDSMDLMFLYPLLCGVGVFLPFSLISPILPASFRCISRVAYNLYNSGIACLTSAAMLAGIVEIAGTGAVWVNYIKTAGIVLASAAAVWQTAVHIKRKHSISY